MPGGKLVLSPTLFLRSAREPPSRRTRVLWERLFWQARCRAVFPAWERGRKGGHISSIHLHRLAVHTEILTQEEASHCYIMYHDRDPIWCFRYKNMDVEFTWL